MIGVVAALAAALCWTLASSLWRRLPTSLGPGQLNLLKNLVALALQLPLLLALVAIGGAGAGGAAGSGGAGPVALLLLSGVVGIALGDSFYLAALRRLGTRRALTFDAAGPALSAIGAALLLAEVPAPRQWLGIGLISLAVLLVAAQTPRQAPRQAPATAPSDAIATAPRTGLVTAPAAAIATAPAAGSLGSPGTRGPMGLPGSSAAMGPGLHSQQGLGILLALAAVFCGVAAALLSRAALREGLFSPLLSATLRLGAAALVMMPMLWRLPTAARRPLPAQRRWPLLLLATLLGTCAGLVLQQTALVQLKGGLAVALLSTGPVMALPLAPLEGDRPGALGLAAALLAVLGVALVAI
ncbi:MAG TPA: EamA family transporter [Synechococcales bacterium UBA10510]|nr:EamA family transporter [Synechococcales bacterium UBA10510]